MGSGQELFTEQEVSRLGAAQEFFTALAVGVASGKLMTATRPVPGWGVPAPVEPVSPGKVEAPPAPPRAVAPAPEPAPAPGSLAPSPELVQALTGKNPTPPVPASSRLRQDTTVKPNAPDLRPTTRPISPSPRQNAQLQRDIEYLKNELGAENIRVNQQQLTLNNGQRVGINRPDLQFDYNHRRYSVEYDSPTSGRGPGHQGRLTANDPEGEEVLPVTGTLEQVLSSLLPLSGGETQRRLFIPTRSAWTAYVTNQWTGTDAASPMSVMARRLSIRCLRVVAVPHTLRGDRGRYGAVMLDVYGPEQPGKIHNYVRALGASNDGGRWVFDQEGEPFPFEQVERYQARRVRERFTFEMLKDYLRHLGLSPFEEDFYMPPGTCAWLIQKTGPFDTGGREYTLEEVRAARVL